MNLKFIVLGHPLGGSLDLSKNSCARINVGLQTTNKSTGGPKMDINSLAHTKWECKYHIVFAPKYRRQVIYKEIRNRCRNDIRNIMSEKRCRNYRGGMYVRIISICWSGYHPNIQYLK